MTSQQDKATRFHALHVPGAPLALANAWDGASARIVASTGAPAVATTSAGVAWGLGAADGGHLARDRAVAMIRRVVGMFQEACGVGRKDDPRKNASAPVGSRPHRRRACGK